ncbi:MAG: TonB C-terminal domain-containing protein [Terracidiphilus sp.]|jgi:protein TonB
MISLLEKLEQLDRPPAPDPLAAPAAGSLVLHCVLFSSLLLYGMLNGFFHHIMWGNPGAGGAIQVSLVSNVLPLPAEQVNENVLTTDTPSQAPAEPTPKTKEAVDEKAIPISGKMVKPQQKTAPKTQKNQPQPRDNRAQYGEQAGSIMPRSAQAMGGSNGPVSVTNGDFGSRFGWYVEVIKRKVDQNWYRAEVDPRTPRGATAQVYFKVSRQGVPSNFKINNSSGSPTLDLSCERATQRVDTFGALPAGSNDQWLDVTYDCAY